VRTEKQRAPHGDVCDETETRVTGTLAQDTPAMQCLAMKMSPEKPPVGHAARNPPTAVTEAIIPPTAIHCALHYKSEWCPCQLGGFVRPPPVGDPGGPLAAARAGEAVKVAAAPTRLHLVVHRPHTQPLGCTCIGHEGIAVRPHGALAGLSYDASAARARSGDGAGMEPRRVTGQVHQWHPG